MAVLNAGRLRHRIEIQERVENQDSTTGEVKYTWQVVSGCVNLPASIEPLSARELIAAQAQKSEIMARIVIRFRNGLNSKMRIIHKSKIYNIHGLLTDKDSGLEYYTIPVSEGVNNG